MANNESAGKSNIIPVVVWSAITGFLTGSAQATWQIPVVVTQVIGNFISYPPDNPHFIYLKKLWSLLNTWGVWLIKAGLDEKQVSILFGGLTGLIYFVAFALIMFNLTGDALLSIGAPSLVQFLGAANFGINYPIQLAGFRHTHGVMGHGLFILSLALLGAGKYRWCGFVMGLAPAFHLMLGASLWVIALASGLMDIKRFTPIFRRALPAFIAGAAIFLGALFSYFYNLDLPKLDNPEAESILKQYIQQVDFHRQPVNFASINVILGVFSILICWLALCNRGTIQHDSGGRDHLFRALLLTGILGVLGSILSHYPNSSIYRTLNIFFPARLWNFSIMSWLTIWIGTLWIYRHQPGIRLNTFIFTILLFILLASTPPFWGRLLLILVLLSLSWFIAERKGHGIHIPGMPLSEKQVYAVLATIILAGILGNAIQSFNIWQWRSARFNYYVNDPLLARLKARPGVLLTIGDEEITQLITRRPTLLAPLDALPYAPEAAPANFAILKKVYGLDIFNLSEESRKSLNFGILPKEPIGKYWQKLQLEEWQEIKRKWGVTDILADRRWVLNLPKLENNPWVMILPDIPDEQFSVYFIP